MSNPALGNRPKVLIATSRTKDDADETFRSLAEHFDIIYDPDSGIESAEYLVLDLSMLPEHWYEFIERAPTEPVYLPKENFHAPCLFVQFPETDPQKATEIPRVLGFARRQFRTEPIVVGSVPELSHHLDWLWSMFHYQRLPREIQSQVICAAIVRDRIALMGDLRQ